jgi:hypothetical protein
MSPAEQERLYREAYNAHERAEQVALAAMYEYLSARASNEALMCLADPEWGWHQRSYLSCVIIDYADDILTNRLDAMVTT